MTLYELNLYYKKEAALIGDYNNMSVTYLANKYCDEEEAVDDIDGTHEHLRSCYLAALMVKYWSKVIKWKTVEAASLNYPDEEYATMLYKALWVAFYYRQWRYEWKADVKNGKFISWKLDENGDKIYNPYYWKRDGTAVDKIIKRCCISIRGKEYQAMNKNVRKANVLLYSLDVQKEELGDSAMADAGAFTEESIGGIPDLINLYLSRNKLVEALVVDSIITENPFKLKKEKRDCMIAEGDVRKANVQIPVFDSRALADYLNSIDTNSLKAFCSRYKILNQDNFISEMKNMKRTTINRYIKKTLTEIRQDPKLLSCIE